MRHFALLAVSVVAMVAGCGGGSGGGTGKTAQTSSAWQLDDPEYTPGNVTSLGVSADGTIAYMTNGASLLTFDVDTGQLNPRSHLTNQFAVIATVDDETSQLYLIQGNQFFPPGFAAVFAFDPATGAQTPLANATSVGPAAYVHGSLYVPGYQAAVVDVISTSGGQPSVITLPNPGSANRTIARTPQGTTLLVGDGSALHVIDPVLERVLYSIPIGIAAYRILPTDENHAVVLGADSFEIVDITDPRTVPEVHPYPFDDGLGLDAPAVLVDGARRLLIVHRVPSADTPGDPYPTLAQPELVVVDIASGALRDRSLVLRQERVDYNASYRLASTADPSTFVFTYENAIYVLRRTEPF